ncbi:MAG: autotransporter domain-containing protein [Pseudomonadota bacterium]
MANVNRMLGCSLISLSISIGTGFAQDTIVSEDRTEPLETSRDGSVQVDAGSTITVSDEAALVIDSDNTVNLAGELVVEGEGTNFGAVSIIGGRALDYTQTGDITIESSIEQDSEDPVTYPTGRWGILSDGQPLSGSISLVSASSTSSADILVESDNGGGIFIAGALDGTFASEANVFLEGDNSTGIRLSGATGDVTFGLPGTIQSTGVESDGAVLDGTYGGQITFGGNIAVTGFTDVFPDAAADPDINNDLQVSRLSGDGLVVLGDVAGGFLIDGFIDVDNNGLFDEEVEPGQAADAVIQVLGSGNALRIDGASFGTLAAEDNLPEEYGTWSFVNRGDLRTVGTYNGLDTTAILINDATFTNGFRNEGRVLSDAETGTAIAFDIAGTTVLPEFFNITDIDAFATGDDESAIAVQIGADATVTSFINRDQLFASSSGGAAIAVIDRSGTLTSFTNTGIITGSADNESDFVDVALDFSANTSGITINNTAPEELGVLSSANFGFINGNVTTGSGDDTFISDAGAIAGDIDLGAGNDLLSFENETRFAGAIHTGTGNDTVRFDNVIADAAINFGTGDSRLELSGGAEWTGTFESAGTLKILIDDADLQINNEDQLALNGLTVQNGAELTFSLADNDNAVARINSTDIVTIDDASSLAFSYAAGFSGTVQTTLIDATSFDIDLAAVNANNAATSSFLVDETLSFADATETSLVLTRRRLEANEVGLGESVQSAFEPVLAALAADTELTTEIYGLTTQEEFTAAFDQLLPDPIDMPLNAVRAQTSTIGTLISDRSNLIGAGRDKVGRFWFQEQFYYLDRATEGENPGYSGGGLVLAMGADAPLLGLDVLGAAVTFSSSRFETFGEADLPSNRSTVGFDVYGAKRLGNFAFDAHGGYGSSSSSSEREIQLNGLIREFDGNWDGSQVHASGRAQYKLPIGERFAFVPAVSFDYLSLTEDGYTEDNPNDSLALEALERDFNSLRVNTGAALTWTRGQVDDGSIDFTGRRNLDGRSVSQVALTAGISQELETDPLTADFRFDGGEVFTLTQDRDETAAYAGLEFIYRTGIIRVSGGLYGEKGDTTTMGSARLSIGVDW